MNANQLNSSQSHTFLRKQKQQNAGVCNLNGVSNGVYSRKTWHYNNFLAKRNASRGGVPNVNFLKAVSSRTSTGENDILKVKEEGVNTLLDCDASELH